LGGAKGLIKVNPYTISEK